MTDLKPQLYGAVYKKQERTKLITTFVLILVLFNFMYFFPKIVDQKKEKYKIEHSEKLFDNPQYRYQDFLDGTLNMDEVLSKKSVIEGNMLHSKDPENYLYIESYISEKLNEIGLEPFSFNNIYNFRNSGRNSVILEITLADKEKMTEFIAKISDNGFLGKNIHIQKEGGIYKGSIELVFDIK